MSHKAAIPDYAPCELERHPRIQSLSIYLHLFNLIKRSMNKKASLFFVLRGSVMASSLNPGLSFQGILSVASWPQSLILLLLKV